MPQFIPALGGGIVAPDIADCSYYREGVDGNIEWMLTDAATADLMAHFSGVMTDTTAATVIKYPVQTISKSGASATFDVQQSLATSIIFSASNLSMESTEDVSYFVINAPIAALTLAQLTMNAYAVVDITVATVEGIITFSGSASALIFVANNDEVELVIDNQGSAAWTFTATQMYVTTTCGSGGGEIHLTADSIIADVGHAGTSTTYITSSAVTVSHNLSAGATLVVSGGAEVTSVTMGVISHSEGATWTADFDSGAMAQATVDDLLVAYETALSGFYDLTGVTINVAGGNAIPSGTGTAAAATLQGLNATVTFTIA